MAEIEIPVPTREGFFIIEAMPAHQFDALVLALNTPKVELSYGLLYESVARCVPQGSPQLFSALLSLHDVNHELKTTHIITDVITSLGVVSAKQNIAFDEKILTERLAALSGIITLAAFSRGVELLIKNERNFGSAITITDTRHVFVEDIEKKGPSAAVLVHQLELTDSFSGKPFFMALDERDLDDLLDVLIRAKKKGNALKSLLKAAGMPYITTNRW